MFRLHSWVPDSRSPGFAAECRRHHESIAKAERTDPGHAETAFRESVSADAWVDLG
jgi:hypothetical protein